MKVKINRPPDEGDLVSLDLFDEGRIVTCRIIFRIGAGPGFGRYAVRPLSEIGTHYHSRAVCESDLHPTFLLSQKFCV